MRFQDLLILSLTSLGRRRLRTVLTTFGIFVGILTIVTMVALAAGVQQEVGRNIAQLGLDVLQITPRTTDSGLPRGVFQDTRQRPITEEVLAELRALPGVVEVTPSVQVPTQIDLRIRNASGTEFRAIPARPVANFGEPFEGTDTMVAGEELGQRDRGVVLSRSLANRLGSDPNALIGQQFTIVARTQRGETAEFPVQLIGIDEARSDTFASGPQDAFDILAWWFDDPNVRETQGYDSVRLRAGSIATVPSISERVAGMGFATNSIQTILDVVNRVFAILQALLAGVGGLSLFVASLGVANTMLMAVYERTREIGIMKATGASKNAVLGLFLTEAGMLGAIGGVTGLTAGWLLSLLVDFIAHKYLESQQLSFIGSISYVPWWLMVGSVVFAILIGVLAGLYPASRAASLDPVAALRHD